MRETAGSNGPRRPLRNIFLFLLQLTRYRFGQLGDAGGQGFQLALDAHQQVGGDGDGKAHVADSLEDIFQCDHLISI
jgi:hypothetical protein